MGEPSIVSIGKSDKDTAAELRHEIEEALKPVCAILDRAAAQGLSVNFQVALNIFGRNVVQSIAISRPL